MPNSSMNLLTDFSIWPHYELARVILKAEKMHTVLTIIAAKKMEIKHKYTLKL